MEEYGHGREFMEDHQPVPQQTPEKGSGKPKTYRRGILTGVLASCGIFVCLIAIAAFVILRGFGAGDLLSGGCLSKLVTLTSIIDYYFYEDVETETQHSDQEFAQNSPALVGNVPAFIGSGRRTGEVGLFDRSSGYCHATSSPIENGKCRY